ncbi:MAG: hypothetical protein ABJE47_16130 [bacterium]
MELRPVVAGSAERRRLGVRRVRAAVGVRRGREGYGGGEAYGVSVRRLACGVSVRGAAGVRREACGVSGQRLA